MLAIGVVLAGRVTAPYKATGTLSASSNPLVEGQEVRGTSIDFFESPAGGTARLINERLQTDAFIERIAEAAGLTESIEAGGLLLDDIRSRVFARDIGETLLTIEATWSDPETTAVLVAVTIEQYLDFVLTTVSEDAEAAVDFYEDRLAEATAQAADAGLAYDAFVRSLPVLAADAELPLSDQLQLSRLNDRVINAQSQIDDSSAAIEASQLSVIQSRSEAGKTLVMIDPPQVPLEPESTSSTQILLLGAFFMLGVVLAAATLLLSTRLDDSVQTAGDVETATGSHVVAAVPRIKALRPPRRLPWKRKSQPTRSALASRLGS
ncbi:hypothetical protein [Ilumatobacter coccineus]|nr:hypothetical protein [Ilumatobacter coccineus]